MLNYLMGAALGAILLWAPVAFGAPPNHDSVLLPERLADYRRARQDGGPGKDGIPSIDQPRFGRPEAADGFLDDDDRVVGLYLDGQARAYPQRILVWQEIVNDSIGDHRVAVTYCPLTGAAIGFDRGETEFGVSGKLVNSNLIMYDRATDTEYPQILAAGIDGELAGRSFGGSAPDLDDLGTLEAAASGHRGAEHTHRQRAQLPSRSLWQLQPAAGVLLARFTPNFSGSQ